VKLSIIHGKAHLERLKVRCIRVGITEATFETRNINSTYDETTWTNQYPDITVRAVRALEMLKNSNIGEVTECDAPTWVNRYKNGIVDDIPFEEGRPV
jgi:hypothetical protein